MSIWQWADFIAAVPPSAQVTLGEGNTPLVRSRRIGPEAGAPHLFFKLESTNPSGSYKDRFAAAAVSHMAAAGKHTCIATSSGNTGAALAAYCAAAGFRCRIAIVETAPLGKTKQMLAYGAELFRVKGFGTDPGVTAETLAVLKALGALPGHSLEVSAYTYSPAGMSGCETISLELVEQAPGSIEHVFCPAGGGGLCVSIAGGFATLRRQRPDVPGPAIECVQPAGNNTIAGPLCEGQPRAQSVQCTSAISGLQVASVIDGDLAIDELRSTGGTGHLVSDEEVWAVQKRLAREEGIFCEPAGAVALAGALNAIRDGRIHRDATVVCLVTGSGFKDEAGMDRMTVDAECPLLSLDDLRRTTK